MWAAGWIGKGIRMVGICAYFEMGSVSYNRKIKYDISINTYAPE